MVTRVQTGVRLETRLLQVLKGLAALKSMSLGDLLEGVCLHAFEGTPAFSPETRARIDDLRRASGLTLTAADSHRLQEGAPPGRPKPKARR
jgi:hypothetical protein